jgi:hypothetical protein
MEKPVIGNPRQRIGLSISRSLKSNGPACTFPVKEIGRIPNQFVRFGQTAETPNVGVSTACFPAIDNISTQSAVLSEESVQAF